MHICKQTILNVSVKPIFNRYSKSYKNVGFQHPSIKLLVICLCLKLLVICLCPGKQKGDVYGTC